MVRYVRLLDGTAVDVGAVARDPWTELVTPDGHVVREAFLPSADFDSTTWVAEDGTAFQRTYNPWADSWSFSQAKSSGITPQGELAIGAGSGRAAHRMRLVRAIALAWVEPPEGARGPLQAVHLQPIQPPRAANVGWTTRTEALKLAPDEPWEAPDSRDAADLPPEPSAARNWADAPVTRRWEWGAAATFATACSLSSDGWLRRPDGSLTQGGRLPDGRTIFRFDVGAVLAAELADAVFGRGVAYRGAVATPRDKAREALQLFVEQNMSLQMASDAMAVSRSEYWQRLHAAVCRLPEPPDGFWDRALWHRPLADAVAELGLARDPVLGDTLRELRDAIGEAAWDGLDDTDAFGMLRLARQLERRRLAEHDA